MPWVGFETTIPAFEQAEIVHALDRAATVIGLINLGMQIHILKRTELLRMKMEWNIKIYTVE
jgi:hypothetical protein